VAASDAAVISWRATVSTNARASNRGNNTTGRTRAWWWITL